MKFKLKILQSIYIVIEHFLNFLGKKQFCYQIYEFIIHILAMYIICDFIHMRLNTSNINKTKRLAVDNFVATQVITHSTFLWHINLSWMGILIKYVIIL